MRRMTLFFVVLVTGLTSLATAEPPAKDAQPAQGVQDRAAPATGEVKAQNPFSQWEKKTPPEKGSAPNPFERKEGKTPPSFEKEKTPSPFDK